MDLRKRRAASVATIVGNKEPSLKLRANDLEGKRWLQNSISIWSDIGRTPEERALKHPAMFPQLLAQRVIETFTNPSQRKVLDPFVGTGSTLIASHYQKKDGIGFDINSDYLKIAQKRIDHLPSLASKRQPSQRLVNANATELLKYVQKNSVDLCFTSPPYWNILTERRSADGKMVRNYSRKTDNLGEIESYQQFILKLQEVFSKVYEALAPKSYCIVNVMDLRKKNIFYPFHMDLSESLTSLGFTLDDIIIWDRRKDYNNLRPLGYPYVFRVNKTHEFLMIFQKRIS